MNSIKSRYFSIAAQLNAPALFIRFATTPQHDGSAHVEQQGDNYCYVVTERGIELDRRKTKDIDVILYWLISELTWDMASDYELRHRVVNQDSRRQLFAKHLELLAKVKIEWSQRKSAEYDQILKEHPFIDKAE